MKGECLVKLESCTDLPAEGIASTKVLRQQCVLVPLTEVVFCWAQEGQTDFNFHKPLLQGLRLSFCPIGVKGNRNHCSDEARNQCLIQAGVKKISEEE